MDASKGMTEAPARSALEAGPALDAHRATLWRLAYQLTGSSFEADDVVQETYVRALERWPPADEARLRAWLVKVATNVGIDHLRRRRRAPYVGPWLPVPIDDVTLARNAIDDAVADTTCEPEAEYALRESVSYAFVAALEALTPRQRAVVLLRDVLGYSAAETADVIGATEASVRVAHHRARQALSVYDQSRRLPVSELGEATQRALGEFLVCLRQGDEAGLEKLLADSVLVATDAGGEFNASRFVLRGRERALHFHLRIAKRRGEYAAPEPCRVNGLPAALVRFSDNRPRSAPVAVLRCELDGDGRIRAIYWVLHPRKIAAFIGSSA